MAQQFPTHPHAAQPPCLAALCSQAKAIATAAAKWVSGRETKCTRLAPVTVDTFHINLEERERVFLKGGKKIMFYFKVAIEAENPTVMIITWCSKK